MSQLKQLKLKSEWMGHPKGSIVNVLEPKAKEMISRGVAKEVDPTESKLQKNESDKMMRKSINK